MKTGKADRQSLMPALYSHRLNEIKDIAEASGYAIAVHGSMQRDLDLIAVPWVDWAVTHIQLATRFCNLLGCELVGKSEKRPHGRRVWTLMMGGACFMDLSVMPLSTNHNEHKL